ncbi:competence protein ComK [Mesobacillus persicus]|uniref:Competence protein ComK n=1 Tax=Mesobacillus persicus TaxID=930146 RepID=A0A1H8K9A6_9BACI|nr:competence protein ComK [Mesobacillus persicus]SEN89307.1 competence protein ComK [Mesobacillus persicus]
MFIEKDYIITPQFHYMRGHYDRFGKLCTQVTETNRTFIVDKSPMEVLNDSIRAIGFNLRGALETSKWLLGDVHMCPIMVNPIHQIVLFPTRSPKHEDTIWLNPNPIKRTTSINRKTLITYNNNTTLIVPVRLSSFNTKLITAEQLRDMTVESANKPFTFVLQPIKRRGVKDKR